MKVTDVRPILTRPSDDNDRSDRTWTFVQVDTDEGISGIGEATNYPGGGSRIVGNTINEIRDAVIGESPFDTDRVWHKIYRRFTYLGSRGMATAVISGIDIALKPGLGVALDMDFIEAHPDPGWQG